MYRRTFPFRVTCLTTLFLLLAIMLSTMLSATAQDRGERWVIKPDPAVVDALHAKLMARNGTLQDLFQMPDPDAGRRLKLPEGLSVAHLNDIPISYPNVRVESSGIINDASHINPRYQDNFDRYVMFVPENKVPFYLFIQKKVTAARSIRSKEILDFFLMDVPGSKYGDDKTAVANKMGDSGSVILLLTGAHRDADNLQNNEKPGQELYEAETPVMGDDWYMTQVSEHRDAGFEEIIHMVQDKGIGATIDDGALEAYEDEIIAAVAANAASGMLTLRAGFDSDSQEYYASIIDGYYGLRDAVGRRRGFGGYTYNTRPEVIANDPLGYALITAFLPEYISLPFSLDPSFSGTFKLHRSEEAYTKRSQYVAHVRITGTNDAEIEGNDQSNIIIANSGDNRIDGGGGVDVVFYEKPYSGFNVSIANGTVAVKGSGSDELDNVEFIVFKDEVIKVD